MNTDIHNHLSDPQFRADRSAMFIGRGKYCSVVLIPTDESESQWPTFPK